MNDLMLTQTFDNNRRPDLYGESDLEAQGRRMAAELVGRPGLAGFFQEIDILKTQMDQIRDLLARLQQSNEEIRTTTSSAGMKAIRARMDSQVSEVLHKAKFIKSKLEALDKANEANRSLPGCEQGSTVDRTRITVTHNVRKSLKDLMDSFQALRQRMTQQHREGMERMYYTVTGQKATEETIDSMLDDEGGQSFLQKAVREQGRGQIIDTIKEIRERHDAVKDIEKNLVELHQIFLDMAVLVEAQGQQIDNIEASVLRASSFVNTGTGHLHVARKHQKNTRKWMCIGIIIVLVIILIIIIAAVAAKK